MTIQQDKMSIEKMYQKKSQLEHILLRPDTYIGSVEKHNTTMWVYDTIQSDREDDSDEENSSGDGKGGQMTLREITYVPGLYKIFDEILVNAADNKQRDSSMNTIRIVILPEMNQISVWNNGRGIPVVMHETEKVYVPEMIFGMLLTSSNYDDSQKKVTGGRNGYGAKLCNIFSEEFVLETSSKEYGKSFQKTWRNNMTESDPPKISSARGDDFTKVTFHPDLRKFGMDQLDRDIVALMQRRAYDVAGSTRGVKVFLNGKRLPVNGFKQYVEQYVRTRTDDQGEPLKMVYEQVNDRWEVAVTVSDRGFQNVSFVNSIATTKGGRHVDYVADLLTGKLVEFVKKSLKKGNMNVKPFQIKQHMWIFVNALIVNPTFDSQTKENMTLQAKSFGSKCELSDKFVAQATKCGISDAVLNWVKFKQQEQMDKKCSNKKQLKLKGIPKLEDANDAGTRNSLDCTLILTEGDSAKTLAVSGLGVVGRDSYGVFPLKGKCLNVREATHKQIMENAEINNIIRILGLQYKRKYDSDADRKTLRYGKLMVMADQDQDGSHIKGLIVNFIHHNWPELIRSDFVQGFITPIVKATKGGARGGGESISFFSIPEYLEWKRNTDNWHTYKVKYYKGLGTSTAAEAKEYFTDMRRHRIPFRYEDGEDDAAIELAFSKKRVEERKKWLTDWMDARRDRRQNGGAEQLLYTRDTRDITFKDFINKELVLFSNMDNERSIPSLVDGLKPGQRKVLFTCFKRNDKREVKVAQLAGSVAEMSEYHHGEVSLMSTIVNLAQNYVGSNNVNLLEPIGQFGTRLQGGKDSASPRYIFTRLSPLTRKLYPQSDDDVLRYLWEDSRRIEPEWYCPIIPLILVNGASGIGTGWSTSIPNYDPREVVTNIRRLIEGEPLLEMKPWYRGFRGEIHQLDQHRYITNGEVAALEDDQSVEITELPIKTWTQAYKESVLEPMLGTDKVPATIGDFKEYHTDATVKFIIRMGADTLQKVETEENGGVHKWFKLQSSISLASMVLFDANGVLRKYTNVKDIVEEFFVVRRQKYIDRKAYMVSSLKAQASKLENQARFILEKISGEIRMENRKKKAIVEELVTRKYDADPVKAWKEEVKRREVAAGGEVHDDEEEDEESKDDEEAAEKEKAAAKLDPKTAAKLSAYDYLVGMSLIKLSTEEKDKLLRERDQRNKELKALEAKTWREMWTEDLDAFVAGLQEYEEKQRRDAAEAAAKATKAAASNRSSSNRKRSSAGKGGAGRGGRKQSIESPSQQNNTGPDPNGRRISPTIDSTLKAKFERADAAKENKGKGRGRKSKDGNNSNNNNNSEAESNYDQQVSTSDQMTIKRKKSSAAEDDSDGDEEYFPGDENNNDTIVPVEKSRHMSKRRSINNSNSSSSKQSSIQNFAQPSSAFVVPSKKFRIIPPQNDDVIQL